MGKPHRDRLSDEERKARRKASAAKYREANRDKCVAASLASRAKKPQKYAAYNAALRDANAEQIRAQQREYHVANKDRRNAASIAWRAANPEKYAAYQRAYAEANSDKGKDRARKWRAENAEKAAEQSRAWAKENPEARRLREHKRRASQRCGSVSPDIYQRLRALQRGLCAVCREKLAMAGEHLDHVMPLALGGPHDDNNLQLLCPPCNLSKNAKHPVDFMQQRGFLL